MSKMEIIIFPIFIAMASFQENPDVVVWRDKRQKGRQSLDFWPEEESKDPFFMQL